MELLDRFFSVAVDYAWGWPLIVLLVGGGAVLTVLTRFVPFVHMGHAVELLRGKWDDPDDPGELSHFQALCTALASTVGVSNIAGVAVAITQGGAGAVFWMWVAAVVGMGTKFVTCTLAVMYRREGGTPEGGPMYYIERGLGPRWRPLSAFFSVCGLVGCLALFQANQLAEVLAQGHGVPPLATGLCVAALVAVVVLGGIQRIGRVTSGLVPLMCGLYVLGSLAVLLTRLETLPGVLLRILTEAFTGTAAAGGAAGIAVSTAIATGVKRAAFSNEAGIGTAPMAHGAAKTKEPVREGLVAMIGPFVDTIVICSMTAFVILSSGLETADGIQGVALTSRAFEAALGAPGKLLVTVSVILFGFSTMVGYSYYGRKCFTYLAGPERGRWYDYVYVASLVGGAVWSVGLVINVLDTAFALMAFPNMVAALLLSPRVVEASRDYFARHRAPRGAGRASPEPVPDSGERETAGSPA